MEIVYHIKPFAELSVGELHAAASLRERVFYLEQHVTTLDADEKDPFSLFLWAECEGQTVGFLRMIPRGLLMPNRRSDAFALPERTAVGEYAGRW